MALRSPPAREAASRGSGGRRGGRSSARPRAAVALARAIVDEIRRRELAPGDRLLSEDEAVARYGVARGTLREALRLLELLGVLRLKTGPGGGAVVDRPDAGPLAGVLSLLLEFADARTRSVLESLATIEPGVAAQAARHATPGDREALAACLEAERAALDDAADFAAAVRRFHERLAAVSGNPVFALLVPALHGLASGVGQATTREQRSRALRAHRALLRAVERRDAVDAEQRMARLLGGALRRLERDEPGRLDGPVRWRDGAV